MFDSAGISSDYTFTKTDEGSLVNISSSGLSGNLGKVGVPKSPNITKTYTPSIPAPSTPSPSATGSSPAPSAQTGATNSPAIVEDEELFSEHSSSYVTTSFDALASEVGSAGGKIEENQLVAYLKTLMDSSKTGSNNNEEIAFVKNLIANFSTLSQGSGYITSFTGLKEAQDHQTVTKAQVTSPVYVRV